MKTEAEQFLSKSTYGRIPIDERAYHHKDVVNLLSDFAAQSVREDRESRWISAKQKPETHELVNVLMTSGSITVGRFLNTNKWGIYTSTGIDIESQTNRVELWQPLPSPPINH